MDLKTLQHEYNNTITQANAIRDKYNGKAEGMTATEETEWSNLLDHAEKIQARIVNCQKQERLERWATEGANSLPMGGQTYVETRDRSNPEGEKKARRETWKKFLTGGLMALNPADIKAYQADNPVGGGFLVAPQDFVQDLILHVKDQVFVRALAKVYTVDRAESLGIPALDTDPSDADWTSELLTGNEETTMAFGKRELRPHPLAKNVKVSNKLLRQASLDAEGIVMDRLAYKFAVTEEKAFLTGDGANKPLGVFTPSAQGISTARDVAAANATSIVADDLISVKYSLKAQYQARAVWILNRAVVKVIRQLKDTTNNYIWTTAIGPVGGLGPGNGLQGTPEMLLERPVYMSEYAPSTITSGLYTALLGDFSRYVIADALDMQMQVLDQLYAATNQTGYIARKETDGMPTLEEAFARLKQA